MSRGPFMQNSFCSRDSQVIPPVVKNVIKFSFLFCRKKKEKKRGKRLARSTTTVAEMTLRAKQRSFHRQLHRCTPYRLMCAATCWRALKQRDKDVIMNR